MLVKISIHGAYGHDNHCRKTDNSENISILFGMILENAQPNARAGALNLKEEKPVKRMAGICRM